MRSPLRRVTKTSIDASRRTWRLPADPMSLELTGSRSTRAKASASASGSSGGTKNPCVPSSTMSGIPPTGVATTGSWWAIASKSDTGTPSSREGRAKTALESRSCATSSRESQGWKVTISATPTRSASARTCSFSPSPARCSWTSRPCSRRSAVARTRTRDPFRSPRRPVLTIRPATGERSRAGGISTGLTTLVVAQSVMSRRRRSHRGESATTHRAPRRTDRTSIRSGALIARYHRWISAP